MKTASPIAACMCAAIFAATSQSWAGLRPSFWLDGATWHATDIVVADEGDTLDGNLTVLEVWKGSLRPGKTLSIPALASFASREARTVKTPFAASTSKSPSLVVSGRRMILFLRHDTSVAAGDGQLDAVKWQPAAGEMQVSMEWVERGDTFAIQQIGNPGPRMLISQRLPEEETKRRVLHIRQTQEMLASIAAVADPAERARDAARCIKTDLNCAREEAFRILEECRAPAVPVLRSLLAEEPSANLRDRIIDAMAAAGGQDLGAEFTAHVAEELEFWQRRAPSLKVGWLNMSGLELADSGLLRDHYMMLHHLLAKHHFLLS